MVKLSWKESKAVVHEWLAADRECLDTIKLGAESPEYAAARKRRDLSYNALRDLGMPFGVIMAVEQAMLAGFDSLAEEG